MTSLRISTLLLIAATFTSLSVFAATGLKKLKEGPTLVAPAVEVSCKSFPGDFRNRLDLHRAYYQLTLDYAAELSAMLNNWYSLLVEYEGLSEDVTLDDVDFQIVMTSNTRYQSFLTWYSDLGPELSDVIYQGAELTEECLPAGIRQPWSERLEELINTVDGNDFDNLSYLQHIHQGLNQFSAEFTANKGKSVKFAPGTFDWLSNQADELNRILPLVSDNVDHVHRDMTRTLEDLKKVWLNEI